MVENNGMAKVHGIRKEVRDREDVPDLCFGGIGNVLAEHDRGLLEVGSLARGIAEVRHDWSNGRSLIDCGSTTEDEIISKQEGVNRRAARTKGNPRKVGVEKIMLQAN